MPTLQAVFLDSIERVYILDATLRLTLKLANVHDY
jgi:hypothetical protein